MKSVRFNPAASLIIVQGYVWGPLREHVLRLALDSGSGELPAPAELRDPLGRRPHPLRAGVGHSAAQRGQTVSSRAISWPVPPGSSIHLPEPPRSGGIQWTSLRRGYVTGRVATVIRVAGMRGGTIELQTSHRNIHDSRR